MNLATRVSFILGALLYSCVAHSQVRPKRVAVPQVMPAPMADPAKPYPHQTQMVVQGPGGPRVVLQPMAQYSNACYIQFVPYPQGCYLANSFQISSPCGCVDTNGAVYPGMVWQ